MPYQIIPPQDPGTGTVAPGDLTGFTATRIPFGDSATALTTSADLTFNDSTNDLSLSASESGGQVGLTVANSSNTASSDAAIIASVAGTSANDAVFRAVVSGTTTWTFGVDNSDSDRFKIAPDADVGTNAAIQISTGGLVGVGGAPVAGRTFTGYGTASDYFRFVKASATAGTWDFGVGAVLVGADNHFTITDSTSTFTPRLTILGTSTAATTGDVVIGPLTAATSAAVVATTDTSGFLRLSTCAGLPTGAATDGALVIDTTGGALQYRTGSQWNAPLRKLAVAIAATDFDALGAADTSEVINLGSALPANARIYGVNIKLTTPFTGGGNAACAVKIGSAGDDDALVSTANLFAAAVDGQVSALTLGIAPHKHFSASTQITGTFSADVGLQELTAGAGTIEILYAVLS